MSDDDGYEARKLARRRRQAWRRIGDRVGCAFLWAPFVVSPFAVTLTRDGTFYANVLGAVCFVVGCTFLATREDQYIVPLLAGIEIFAATGAVQLWRPMSSRFKWAA